MAIANDELARGRLDDLTIDQLEGRFEFVHGRYEERQAMGAEANRIATVLMGRMEMFASESGSGICFTQECGYQIFPHEPRRVRYPDGSFIRNGRLPGNRPPRGHVDVAPDLVVEVISPNDLAENVDERLTDFLRAGVPLIWLAYPLTRHVQVYRQDGSGTRLGPDGVLDGEEVIPVFSCSLRDLFSVIDGDIDAEAAPAPAD